MDQIIFKNTVFQFLARSSTTLVGFLITILLARSFGATGFGEYTKIISLVSLFYLIIDFGLNAAFVRDKVYTFSHILYSRIGISFFLFIFINLIVFLFPYNSAYDTGFSPIAKFGILIFSLTFFTQAVIFSTAGVFQKKMKYQYFMISQVLGAFLNLFLILIFINLSFSILLVVTSFVIAGIFSSIVSLFFVKQKPSFTIKVPKELFIVSVPLAAMLIFNLVYFKIDAIILTFFKPTQDVGVYGLAYKFFEFLIALPLFLSNSLFPHLSTLVNRKDKFSQTVKKYTPIFLIASLVVAFASFGLSPLLVLINNDFSQAILPFRILIISLPLFFLTSFYQWVLIALNKQKFLMLVYFVNAVLNIVLNLIFIPQFSYNASATITVIGETFVFLCLIWQFSRIFSERK